MSDQPSFPMQVKLAEKIFDTGLFSDLVLELKNENNETRELKVHRGILAKVSPVWFQWMHSESESGRIVIENFSFETIRHVLYFCYTGHTSFESLDMHLKVLQAADHCCMLDLIEFCTKQLCAYIVHSSLLVDDFLVIFEYAVKFQNTIVVDHCLAYLEENPKTLLDYKDFSSLSLELILTILKSKFYFSTEYELLSYVFCWIRETCKASSEALDEYLVKSTIIQHLYLNRLSLEELRQLYHEFEKDLPGSFWLNINTFAKVDIPSDLHIPQETIIRGGENENMLTEIIVRNPPMTIKEKFFIYDSFILDSIDVVQRINTSGIRLAVDHLEHITVSIEDIRGSAMSFTNIVSNSSTITLKPTASVQVSNPDSGFIAFSITFFRPGLYKKNTYFSNQRQKFFRPENGVITNINVCESNDLDVLR